MYQYTYLHQIWDLSLSYGQSQIMDYLGLVITLYVLKLRSN